MAQNNIQVPAQLCRDLPKALAYLAGTFLLLYHNSYYYIQTKEGQVEISPTG